MTELLRDWLLGIVAAALAVALAQALTPEGAVKKISRLVGGLVLLLAVVRPFVGAELPRWEEIEGLAPDISSQVEENEALFAGLVEEQSRHDGGKDGIP